MLKRHVKRTKIFFSALVILIIAILSLGSFMVSNIIFSTSIKQDSRQNKNLSIALDDILQAHVLGVNDYNIASKIGVPILIYHGIVDEIDQSDNANITTENFKKQISALKENGYSSITTRELLSFYNGESGLPKKPVLITFDDGRKDSVLNGNPILEEFGFKAVMFVVTEKQEIKDNFFLSWEELNMMQKSGRWDIQAHGYKYHDFIPIDNKRNQGHFASNKMWLEKEDRLETNDEYEKRLFNDLNKVKNDLEKNINGAKITAFAFPFGDYGADSINIDKKYAIKTNTNIIKEIFQFSFGFNTNKIDFDFLFYKENAAPHLITRLTVGTDWDGIILAKTLKRHQTRSVPYSLEFFIVNDMDSWSIDWGNLSVGNNQLIILANKDETGGMTILNGGRFWKNYLAEANISIKSGRSGSLVGRYKNENNYVLCTIDGSGLFLKQLVDGKYTTLASKEYKKIDRHYKIGLNLIGNTASCAVDGIILGPVAIDKLLNQGSVGFKMWDIEKGMSEMHIENIDIKESYASIAYFGGIKNNENFNHFKEHKEYIDFLIPTWYRFTESGKVERTEWGKEKLLKMSEGSNVAIMPMLSNWNPSISGPDRKLLHSMLADETVKKKVVENILVIIEYNKFSGINVDFENVAAEDKDLFTDFFIELSNSLHNKNYIASIALSAKTENSKSSWAQGFDYKELGKYADLVVIMAYNNHNLNSQPGPIASSQWTSEVIEYAVSNIERQKIVLGIGYYGYDWLQKENIFKGYKQFPANLSFDVSQELIKSFEANNGSQDIDGYNFTYKDRDNKSHIVWVESLSSVGYKINLIKKYNFAGFSIWSLGREENSFWGLIEN